MFLKGTGCVISQRSVQSTKDPSKNYHFLKLIDDNDSELEVICESKIMGIKRFDRVDIEVDVIQGKYPQYRLKDIQLCQQQK